MEYYWNWNFGCDGVQLGLVPLLGQSGTVQLGPHTMQVGLGSFGVGTGVQLGFLHMGLLPWLGRVQIACFSVQLGFVRLGLLHRVLLFGLGTVQLGLPHFSSSQGLPE